VTAKVGTLPIIVLLIANPGFTAAFYECSRAVVSCHPAMH
jgi:hypothetical protein